MSTLERKFEPYFTQPVNQILTMVILVGITGAGIFLAYPAVAPIFLANPYLNGFIIMVFITGLLSCFGQVFSLIRSVNWIEGFAIDRPGHDQIKPPSLLASLAAMLSEKHARFALTSTSTRSILDSVATRLDEGREITRYIINLLIFLGLLGTFYGLAITVPAIVETIGTLADDEGGSLNGFNNLMRGLEEQLDGMGTAFGSSLLGLAGSLIVGLLDLFAGRGQNRFYRELEEWLSSITKLGIASNDGTGESVASAGLFESASRQMEGLQMLLAESVGNMDKMQEAMTHLIEVTRDAQSGNYAALQEISGGQRAIVAALESMQQNGEGLLDAETRMRLRNMDQQLLRILEELSAGRAQSSAELRGDLANLVRSLEQKS